MNSNSQEVNINAVDSAENLAERRYLWTARAFAIVSAISFCCNIVLILAIFQLNPLSRVKPFLLTFSGKETQVVDIKPLAANMDNAQIREITETFVRQYVLLSNTMLSDLVEMRARWLDNSPMQEMSASDVFNAFVESANRGLALISQEGLTREVKILSSNELTTGLWQVEFEIHEMRPDYNVPEVIFRTASVRVRYRPKRVTYEERLKNPLGFTVIEYNIR